MACLSFVAIGPEDVLYTSPLLKEYPVSWVRSHGKGRVFYCSLGVQKAPYSNPLFLRYLLGGIQFTTGDLKADTTPSEK